MNLVAFNLNPAPPTPFLPLPPSPAQSSPRCRLIFSIWDIPVSFFTARKSTGRQLECSLRVPDHREALSQTTFSVPAGRSLSSDDPSTSAWAALACFFRTKCPSYWVPLLGLPSQQLPLSQPDRLDLCPLHTPLGVFLDFREPANHCTGPF